MEQQKNASMVTNGGDGPYSYAKNSAYQMEGLDAAMEILKEEISKNLDLRRIYSGSPSRTFCIADFGCSTGPNTFAAMHSIINHVALKCCHQFDQGVLSQIPQFVVFFNDKISNDFNQLFASIPPDKPYFAAAVAGSFHNRLLPKASLHFVYSAYSLHWLSMVPTEVEDVNSLAWNKGRISYGDAPKEVVDAYSAQLGRDLESFLCARAEELVSGGFMALIIVAKFAFPAFEILGSCLMDMARKGRFSEAKVDSFNLPMYFPSLEEIESFTKSNEYFVIERLQLLDRPNTTTAALRLEVQGLSMPLRVILEGLITSHFGSDIIDELFDLFAAKLIEIGAVIDPEHLSSSDIFVLLKRK